MEHKLAPIKREHIEQAAKIIDKEGMPASYVGNFMVEVNDKSYHFKYITRLAYKLATGVEVEPDYFQSNENYRQKIIDLGFQVYVPNQPAILENPFILSDEKLGVLLEAYSNWLSKRKESQGYITRLKEGIEQIQNTFLNPAFLEIKNAQFKGEIKAYISKLDGPVGINLGNTRITENLTNLKNIFTYIIKTQDDPFYVVNALLDGKKKIKYFSKAFWSPVLQARYPNIIPNWNNKTESLLKVLGVNVKTSKLNNVEKLRKISEAFQYLQQLNPKLDFFHLNHLMHFGSATAEGEKLVTKLLNEATLPLPEIVVKPDEFQSIGLLASDSGDWVNAYMNELEKQNHIVIWWDKKPSGGNKVLSLLKVAIKTNQFFYLYISYNNTAYYRIKVVDISERQEYQDKKWNLNEDVAEYAERFEEFSRTTKSGKTKSAEIAFLVDEILKLKEPIPVDYFVYLDNFQPPTQNNLQPFVKIIEPPTPPPAKKKNLYFTDADRDIIMAIKTKPFILLAGLSGTGKSRLVRKLAFETCIKEDLRTDERKPGNFELVTVRPNWHDSTELMGYITRISGIPKYVPTSFLRFVVKAWQHIEIPFFLCLDEMNLAPVEQYFAEYLSVVETRDLKSNGIVTDAIITKEHTDNVSVFNQLLTDLGLIEKSALWNRFISEGISIPPNLIVMGTVNMDETTHSFSRKVLDRAMTIEMNKVELNSGLEPENAAWKYPDEYIDPEYLISNFTGGGQVYHLLGHDGERVIDFLLKLNAVLDKTPFKIAYRVRDEFLIYCYHNSKLYKRDNSNWLHTCLDEMTFMKVLSRVEGDDAKTRSVLVGLNQIIVTELGEGYSRSVEKLKEMLSRLDNNGYTSFWA